MSIAHPIRRPSQMHRPLVCKPMDKAWKESLKDRWWSTNSIVKPANEAEAAERLRMEDFTLETGESYELSYTLFQDHNKHKEVFGKAKHEDPYGAAKARYGELLEAAECIELWQLDPFTGQRALMIMSRVA